MKAALILLYVAAAGVNYGWQPADDAPDGYEYIVQVEPELLDGMRAKATPIEKNVPPEIAPIRKVRSGLGRGELPRATAAVNRTAYFAGQAGWTPDRYGPIEPAATAGGQRYSQPSLPGSKVAPPPSVLERAQTAVTETSDTLREGVEASLQTANDQFTRGGEELLDATRDAGQEFGNQLEAWTSDAAHELQTTRDNIRTAADRTVGAVGNRVQQVTNPFANSAIPATTGASSRGTVAPPPWDDSPASPAPLWQDRSADASVASAGQAATASRTATRGATGWTSIGASVAAPPLIIPPLSTTARTSDARPIATATAANDGPQFPEPPPRRESIHSPLTDPADRPAGTAAADSWSDNWGSAPSTPQVSINRAGNSPPNAAAARNSDLVNVEPVAAGQQANDRSTNRFENVWDNAASWGQPSVRPPALPAQQNLDLNTAAIETSQPPANNSQISSSGTDSAGTNPAQPSGMPSAENQPTLPARQGDEPWLPLLLVSLSLMGSLSANLFLGWSYMDARQKYRSLVRKTADKFRRAAAA